MEVRDLYRHAKMEADRCCTALGTPANWNEQNWWPWATDKLMEHMQGLVCWHQFGAEKFGILDRNEELRRTLLHRYESYKSAGMSNPDAFFFLQELNGLLTV